VRTKKKLISKTTSALKDSLQPLLMMGSISLSVTMRLANRRFLKQSIWF